MTMETKCVADFAGPWTEPDWESSLIARCRTYWSTPICDLPDIALVTFLNQRIAHEPILQEARRRIAAGASDNSELFDGQRAEAAKRAASG